MSLSFVNKNHWQYSSFSSLEFRLPNKNHYSSSGGKGEGLWEIPLFPYTLALEECRSEGILGRVFEVLQSWVPFVNYTGKLATLFDDTEVSCLARAAVSCKANALRTNPHTAQTTVSFGLQNSSS